MESTSNSMQRKPVSKDVLVIGGGVAGLESALSLASLGHETVLVEQGDLLGGNAARLFPLYGCAEEPARLIESRIAAARENPLIQVNFRSTVTAVEGDVGSFHVRMNCAAEAVNRDFGAIILATGFELDSTLPKTGRPQCVISHLELERRLAALAKGEPPATGAPLRVPSDVCFVVRDSGEDSAIYAASALKNALAIKELARSNVFVCCQNFNVSGEGLEKLYREARSRGVIVFKFDDEQPQISPTDTGLRVSLRDYSAGSDGEWKGLVWIECNLLVLPERIVPASSARGLQSLLKVTGDSSNRFQENNVWLKPTASNRKGIFFVGGCRGSFDVEDILTEARSTALEIDNLLRASELAVEAGGVVVNASKCALCLTCLRSCPHGAVEVVFDEATGTKAARIIDAACQACGICVAECPAKAIEIVPEKDVEERVAVPAQA